MIRLPLDTFEMYEARLIFFGISSRENPHYVKWVRYSLNFEAEYGADESLSIVMDAILVK